MPKCANEYIERTKWQSLEKIHLATNRRKTSVRVATEQDGNLEQQKEEQGKCEALPNTHCPAFRVVSTDGGTTLDATFPMPR